MLGPRDRKKCGIHMHEGRSHPRRMNPGEQEVSGGLAGRAGTGRELTINGDQQITGNDSVKSMVQSNSTSFPQQTKWDLEHPLCPDRSSLI